MIFAAVNPVSARQYFKRQVLLAFTVLGGMFLLLVTLFSWLASGNLIAALLGNGVAALATYFTYVTWNKQPMRIRCRRCRKIVVCKTPWLCGECDHENWDVHKKTFLDECENCQCLPKSYICHHCNEPIFLSPDMDATNPARRITAQGRAPKARSEVQQTIDERLGAKRRDIELAKLDLTKERIKAEIEATKKGIPEIQLRTALEILWERLKKFMDERTALSEVARRQKAINAEAFKNDPTERRKCDLIVEHFVQTEIAKMTSEKGD